MSYSSNQRRSQHACKLARDITEFD